MALSAQIRALNEHVRLVALCLNTSAAGAFITGVIAPITKTAPERDGGTAVALTMEAVGLHIMAHIILTLVRQET